MTNKARLTLPFGAPHDAVYCPMCGTRLLYPETEAPCVHLAYVYLEELGEFILVAPHLKQATETALDFDDDDVECDVLGRLHEAAPSESILHLEIETSGMACGPVESTLYIGFDFAPPAS